MKPDLISPILVFTAPPMFTPGNVAIPGARPRIGSTAYGLAVSRLVPLLAPELSTDARARLRTCLPPVGFVPPSLTTKGEEVEIRAGLLSVPIPGRAMQGPPVDRCERIGGFLFQRAALDFVRAHHPGVAWAPAGAEGFSCITEIDLLHGFVSGQCVAVVCRMAPT